MYPNPIFRGTAAKFSVAFARERGFGALTTNGDGVPIVAHVPFLLDEDAATIGMHLVRSNSIARVLKSGPCLATLCVTGPDGYVSPDWYGVEDQVPTWNYIAVHFTGRLELRPSAELHDLLDRQSAHFESQLTPKVPWTSSKMSPGVMDRMMRAIVPVHLHVSDMQSTWKLGQNKPQDARRRAAGHLKEGGIGTDRVALSQWMDSPPHED